MKKVDLRVLRTQKMVYEGFISLLEEKDYEKITVQEISDRAMINRATFYAHFKDKQDLFDSIYQTIIENFIAVFQSDQPYEGNQISIKNIEQNFVKIYEKVKKNKRIFMMILKTSSTDSFHNRIVQAFTSESSDLLKKLQVTESNTEVPLDLIVEFLVAIFVSTIKWWITSDMDMEPQELAHLTVKLVRNGHLKVMGIEIVD